MTFLEVFFMAYALFELSVLIPQSKQSGPAWSDIQARARDGPPVPPTLPNPAPEKPKPQKRRGGFKPVEMKSYIITNISEEANEWTIKVKH